MPAPIPFDAPVTTATFRSVFQFSLLVLSFLLLLRGWYSNRSGKVSLGRIALRRYPATVGFFGTSDELMLALSLEVEEPLVATLHFTFSVGFDSFV